MFPPALELRGRVPFEHVTREAARAADPWPFKALHKLPKPSAPGLARSRLTV